MPPAGILMTHAESIELFRALGARMTPELKAPEVAMPFDGLTRNAYAQRMIDDYIRAGIPPADVFPQSFDLNDVLYWIEHTPEFGRQAIWLDGRNPREMHGDPAHGKRICVPASARASQPLRRRW